MKRVVKSQVSGGGRPLTAARIEAAQSKPGRNARRFIGRSVIDKQNFRASQIVLREGLQARGEVTGRVIGRDDDRDGPACGQTLGFGLPRDAHGESHDRHRRHGRHGPSGHHFSTSVHSVQVVHVVHGS